MLIFIRVILLFYLIIEFHYFHIKFTLEYHSIIHIYIIIQQHVKLYKKNNIIINAAEHEGTIEENHSHIDTPGLVGDQDKTHYDENPFKIFFLLDCIE